MAALPPSETQPDSVAKPEIKIKGLPPGWRREVVIRKNGQSAGKTDVYYYSPCGKKFRSKPQIARFLGDCADLSCFDFSRAGTPGDGTQRRRARDRTAKRSNMGELSRPPQMAGPLTTNPLRPSGPIRRTCGVIKLPVTCVPAQADEDYSISRPPPINGGTSDILKPPQNLTLVVPSLWENRLHGVKAYDHETGSEIAVDMTKPQNGLSLFGAGDLNHLQSSASSTALQSLAIQQQSQQRQSSLSGGGIQPGHSMIQGLKSPPLGRGSNSSFNSLENAKQKTVSNCSSTSSASLVSGLFQANVKSAASGDRGALFRENGQQQQQQNIGQQQSHLTGKDLILFSLGGGAKHSTTMSQLSSSITSSSVPRMTPVVVNGPAKTSSVSTSGGGEGEMSHFVSDRELLMQEEKVRLLRQKVMAAQNSA